ACGVEADRERFSFAEPLHRQHLAHAVLGAVDPRSHLETSLHGSPPRVAASKPRCREAVTIHRGAAIVTGRMKAIHSPPRRHARTILEEEMPSIGGRTTRHTATFLVSIGCFLAAVSTPVAQQEPDPNFDFRPASPGWSDGAGPMVVL